MVSRPNISYLILIFVIAAILFAATFAFYYTDERHYTDGALNMLQGHGWFIPENADGSPRLQKPPLAYWAIAASYKIFGVGVFASRLPFLLVSCGTLLLTFLLARKLTGRSEIALLAAVVLASNPQFFLCSVRSIPDPLLVFFITASAFGFLRLIVFQESAASAFWLAYGGAAGAAMSKGLFGILIVAFAWAFFILKNRDWRALGRIIHWPILITAFVLGASWFIYIFWKNPALAWHEFVGDQVMYNVRGHFWSPLLRAPVFAVILIVNFLPWSATALEFVARKKVSGTDIIPPSAKNFILAWTIILILGFSLGFNLSLRYLLPATPLMAILFAAILSRAEEARLFFSVERILKFALVALALGDAVAFIVVSQWPLPIFLSAAVCLLILFSLVVLGRGTLRQKKISPPLALGAAILAGGILFFYAAMPVNSPNDAEQIAALLRQNKADSSKSVLVLNNLQLASRLRVCLGGKWDVAQMDEWTPALNHVSRLLVSEKELYKFSGHGWDFKIAGLDNTAPPPAKLWAALKSRKLPEMLTQNARKIFLVTRQ